MRIRVLPSANAASHVCVSMCPWANPRLFLMAGRKSLEGKCEMRCFDKISAQRENHYVNVVNVAFTA